MFRRLTTQKEKDDYRNYEINSLREKYGAHPVYIYDIIIVKYSMEISGKTWPCLKVWKAKAGHPFENHYYRSIESRQKKIDCLMSSAESRVSYKAKQQRKRREFVHSVKVGDIFYTSWGYDQTNREFWQVVEVKGKFVIVREIYAKHVEATGPMSDNCVAVKDSFKEDKKPLRRKVLEGNIIKTDADFIRGYLYKGEELYRSWGH